MKQFPTYFSALDADEHTEIPADTVQWLANIACEYFRVTTLFNSECLTLIPSELTLFLPESNLEIYFFESLHLGHLQL